MCALDQAFFSAARIGECAGLEAEHFAFEQGIGKRCAVQFDQRHGSSRAVVVDASRQNAFAGPALALDQDRGAI